MALLAVAGCGGSNMGTPDSSLGLDSGTDAALDSGTDAALDSGTDAGPTLVVVDDFEGDTSDWTLGGGASIETDTNTTSNALHLSLANGACGVAYGELTVTIPGDAASLRYQLSGDIAAHSDNQLWLTLREDSVSVYGLGIPPLPLTEPRTDSWCIPDNGPGQTVTLSFVIRTQSACNAMEAWLDDIVFSTDATGCTPMPSPT
ncbi:MAG: hypothetical protein H6725_18095 [Sandaracinaceae bacterium]|nr:hypothetical protein [Sandaracinaceae bacterium]